MTFEAFTIDYLQTVMAKPGGRAFLIKERQKIQGVRDDCAQKMADTIGEIDNTLAKIDLVLHNGVQA